MTTERVLSTQAAGQCGDTVRRDFIAAYAQMWNCSLEYAEGMLTHVETVAADEREAEVMQWADR